MLIVALLRVARALRRAGEESTATALERAVHVDLRPRPYRGAHSCGQSGRYGWQVRADSCPACYGDALCGLRRGGLVRHPGTEVRVPARDLDVARELIRRLAAADLHPPRFAPWRDRSEGAAAFRYGGTDSVRAALALARSLTWGQRSRGAAIWRAALAGAYGADRPVRPAWVAS